MDSIKKKIFKASTFIKAFRKMEEFLSANNIKGYEVSTTFGTNGEVIMKMRYWYE